MVFSGVKPRMPPFRNFLLKFKTLRRVTKFKKRTEFGVFLLLTLFLHRFTPSFDHWPGVSRKPLTNLANATSGPDRPISSSQEVKCTPRDSVFFLKTHKCASTTVQRIFLRYGWYHGLSFVLPVNRNVLGSPRLFDSRYISPDVATPDNRYQMFVLHSRFNPLAIKQVMKEGSPWVTILREPSSLFDSLWNYFDMEEFFGVNLTFFSQVRGLTGVNRRGNGIGLNQMMFDLGYDMPIKMNPAKLHRSFQELADHFDLVMIAERFDESLILLKYLMCWTTQDVANIKLNFRARNNTNTLGKDVRLRLRKQNYPDVMLYDFFRGIFKQKVKDFGKERMKGELKELRKANAKLFAKCFSKELVEWDAESNARWKNRKVMGWKLRDDTPECKLMLMTEIEFTDMLRHRQTAWRFSGWQLNMKEWKMPESQANNTQQVIYGYVAS